MSLRMGRKQRQGAAGDAARTQGVQPLCESSTMRCSRPDLKELVPWPRAASWGFPWEGLRWPGPQAAQLGESRRPFKDLKSQAGTEERGTWRGGKRKPQALSILATPTLSPLLLAPPHSLARPS